jgi:hypothetical protein
MERQDSERSDVTAQQGLPEPEGPATPVRLNSGDARRYLLDSPGSLFASLEAPMLYTLQVGSTACAHWS